MPGQVDCGVPRAVGGVEKKQTHLVMAWTVILGMVVWKCREDRTRGAEIVERRAGLRTRIGLNGIGESDRLRVSATGRTRCFYRVGRNAAGGLISRSVWCGRAGARRELWWKAMM